MTPFVDSASTCLSIVSQERFSCFGKLNSLLTRNQPLSSVDEWMYTIFQTKSCSTFVEQHPPCITYKTCNIYTTGNELPSQSERSGLFGKYQNTCLQWATSALVSSSQVSEPSTRFTWFRIYTFPIQQLTPTSGFAFLYFSTVNTQAQQECRLHSCTGFLHLLSGALCHQTSEILLPFCCLNPDSKLTCLRQLSASRIFAVFSPRLPHPFPSPTTPHTTPPHECASWVF